MTWLYGVALKQRKKLYDKNIIVYQAIEQRRERQKRGRNEEKENEKGNQINFQNRSRK